MHCHIIVEERDIDGARLACLQFNAPEADEALPKRYNTETPRILQVDLDDFGAFTCTHIREGHGRCPHSGVGGVPIAGL